MTVTKRCAGVYFVTGWIGRAISQYAVHKTQAGHWLIHRTYGHGPTFHGTYKTKRAAVFSITIYGD